MSGTIKHEWNGTILTITSDSGTSSCDLKGEKGDTGIRGAQGAVGEQYKPQYGIDYFTNAEIDNFLAEVNDYVDTTCAPAGFGIGNLINYEALSDDDIDNILISQISELGEQTFKRIVLSLKSTNNFTGGGGHYYADIYKLSMNYAIITIKSYIQGGRTMQRTWFSGALTPWEWITPPMLANTEYRTTKRHNGKVIYTKLVEFGALPNNAEKSVPAMPANANLIKAAGYAVGTNYNIPIPGYYAIKSFGSTRSSGSFWLSTTADMSSYNAWITIEYTKD